MHAEIDEQINAVGVDILLIGAAIFGVIAIICAEEWIKRSLSLPSLARRVFRGK